MPRTWLGEPAYSGLTRGGGGRHGIETTFVRAGAAAGAGLLLPLEWGASRGMRLPGARSVPRAYAAPVATSPNSPSSSPPRSPRSTPRAGDVRLRNSAQRAPVPRRAPAHATFGYAGASYLGPTFEVRRGMPITVNWTNNLGAHPLASVIDTTLHGAVEADKTRPRVAVHLHGGHVEARSDGGPKDTFLPGSAYTYNYANVQEATTLWYHDHALGITRLNVFAGLAGFYWIRDDRDTGQPDNPLGLPAGTYEVPLVIQDKRFSADGTISYPPLWPPSGPPAGLAGPADLGPGVLRRRGCDQRQGLAEPQRRPRDLSLPDRQRLERPLLQPAAIERPADAADRDRRRPAERAGRDGPDSARPRRAG